MSNHGDWAIKTTQTMAENLKIHQTLFQSLSFKRRPKVLPEK